MSHVLVVRQLSVAFGSVHAVDGVDFTIDEASVVGLIGPNGAGKTSCVDAITGFVDSTGCVEFCGSDISREPPHRRARRGLARTWQSVELFDDLTVAENLRVAAHRSSWRGVMADMVRPIRASNETGISRAVALLGIDELVERRPDELSHGQRKLVGVARALTASPRLVCMDEPAAGLDSTESDALGAIVGRVADRGTSVLLVEHDLRLIADVCDTVVVFDGGRVIASGPPETVLEHPSVIRAYLGESPWNGSSVVGRHDA